MSPPTSAEKRCRELAWDAAHQMLRPPPDLSPSEWVSQHRILYGEATGRPGPIDLSLTPYVCEPLDAMDNDDVSVIVLRFASQLAKTETLLSMLAWMVSEDPGPALWVMPSTAMAQGVSRDRINPMLSRTPALQGLVSVTKSRDSDNTTFRKRYINGQLTITSSSSVDGLVGRPIRFLYCDEIDRMLPNIGGDPLAQAIQRTASFARKKIILSGTPLVKDFSRIDEYFERGDQRHWTVTCLDCGHEQPFLWEQVEFRNWDDTRYQCRSCNYPHTEQERRKLAMGGKWVATETGDPGIVSYHLSALASLFPAMTMNALARQWHDVHRNPEQRRTFMNEKLALSYEEEGDTPLVGDPVLIDTTPYKTLPVVAATDVQGDRLETTLVAIDEEDRLVVLDHVVLFGDPTRGDVWTGLDELRASYDVKAHAIDSGYLSEQVQKYVSPRRRQVVLAIKGEAAGIGGAVAKRRTRAHRGSAPVRMLNVDELKLRVTARLNAGKIVFAQHLQEDYFRQLQAEKLVGAVRRGVPTRVWKLKAGERNEALDCLAYIVGLLELTGVPKHTTALVPREAEKPVTRTRNQQIRDALAR